MKKTDRSNTGKWSREIEISSGVFEYFETVSIPRGDVSEIPGALAWILRPIAGREPVSATVFRPAENAGSDPVLEPLRSAMPVAIVGGRENGYFSISATGYRFADASARSFERFEVR